MVANIETTEVKLIRTTSSDILRSLGIDPTLYTVSRVDAPRYDHINGWHITLTAEKKVADADFL